MKAWSEIERAKFAHDHEDYSTAMKHYEKIASLLKPSKLWSYLSSDFLAWAILEQAEDLSRKESSIESIEAFKKAAELFKEAKETFEEEIGKIQNLDEKEKAIELSKAFIQRKDYCFARVNVEEARIYDRKGDYAESAGEYDSAADMFEKILEVMETEVDRKEMKAIAYMCRAWEKMKMADARDSAELYHEASELFLKAKEHSTRDKAILLASGNCAFCKALEHGTRFEAGKEKDDFSKAKQYLETASNYYLKAGFDSASLWTGATEVLFDAYNYMVSAEIDVDPDKKMKAYLLAEKCLERSAGLYETAGYVGKRDEVLKTLNKVKEKREFALSLGDFLTVPSAASSTSIMSAPSLTIEEPVGLLKFERAFVQANLIARQREVVVGEDFDLEIQLANLGKNTAFLIKVEEIIPEGFDLVEKPEKCVVEDGFLSLKGKKLAPLETGEMKLRLKPKKKGKRVFTPKIQYMDEAGEYKSCELEQVTVNVKELGIRGWLRGPG
jgi:tetratricopeptide (TPR) repeat protein